MLSDNLVEMLKAPFNAEEISWKPQTVDYKNKTAMAVAYADPRAYVDRLNEVFGIGGWSDHYILSATPFTKVIKGKKAWGKTQALKTKYIQVIKFYVYVVSQFLTLSTGIMI